MRKPKKVVGWSAQVRINDVETFITVQAEDMRNAKKSIEKALSIGESLLHVHETETVSKRANLLAGLEAHDMDSSKLVREPVA